MRRTRLLLPLIVLFAGCAKAAPPTLVGRYQQQTFTARDDPSWRGVVGDWTHEFRADGRLIVRHTGGMGIEARWRLDGDVLTITDLSGSGSCRHFGSDSASARYRVHLDGDLLRYEPLRDECTPRRSGMTIHPWRRASG
jgi:hypothetical protein